MKKLIVVAAMAIFGLVGVKYLHSRGSDIPKIVEDGSHFTVSSEVEIEGHVVGMIYEHCKSCSQGVYLPHKEDKDIRCTYCGEKKGTGG